MVKATTWSKYVCCLLCLVISGRTSGHNLLDCGRVQNPSNGHVSFDLTTLGNAVNYTCNPGYVLEGPATRYCQPVAVRWSGDEPTCQREVICSQLERPVHGNIMTTGNGVGSTASYSCDNTFELVGNSVRFCGTDGRWIGQIPTCQRVHTCSPLGRPVSGDVTIGRVANDDQILPGSVAVYTCSADHQLLGSSIRVCQSDGTWSESEPTCEANRFTCPDLEDPEHGSISQFGNVPGSLATYICDEGFEFDSGVSSIRICGGDGQWSGEVPVCELLDCGELHDPDNGEVVYTTTTFGSTATYSCNSGFDLVGQSSVTCSSSGRWSGIPPTCQSIDCGRLDDPENGRVLFFTTTYGSTASYSCDSGHRLVGSSSRTCQTSGEWSGAKPTCQTIHCNDLEDPEHGSVRQVGNTVGSVATYSCDEGFEPVSVTRFCGSDGQWTRETPTCERVDCGSVSHPRNGRVMVSTTTFRSTANYLCSSGYSLVGVNSRTCQANGQWSGITPTYSGTQPRPQALPWGRG